MKDDVAAPNLGQANKEFDAQYFWASYRTIEQWMQQTTSKGNVSVAAITADTFTVSGDFTVEGEALHEGDITISKIDPGLFLDRLPGGYNWASVNFLKAGVVNWDMGSDDGGFYIDRYNPTTGAFIDSPVTIQPDASVVLTGGLTALAMATTVGGIVSASNVFANGNSFIGGATNTFLATGSAAAGTIWFRPNGIGSATGQASISSAGNMSVSGTMSVTSTTALGGNVTVTGNVLPNATGTRDLGSASLRWGVVYTSDLSLNNGIGDWTIFEGEDDLFIRNNKKGKTYRFTLTEVDDVD